MRRMSLIVMALLIGLLAIVVGRAPGARVLAASQQTPSTQSGQQAQRSDMAEMMMHHQHMMADLKASDARIDELVAAMNRATGDARVEAIAQVVNELVLQERALHEHMGMMGNHMMMGSGGMPGR
jgi:hypothetical protein